jgi:hypothetical protein
VDVHNKLIKSSFCVFLFGLHIPDFVHVKETRCCRIIVRILLTILGYYVQNVRSRFDKDWVNDLQLIWVSGERETKSLCTKACRSKLLTI